MGKKRRHKVLVVCSIGDCLSPMLAGYLNAEFDRLEGSNTYHADYARAFAHDDESPKEISTEARTFMEDIGIDTGSLSKKVRYVGDEEIDLDSYNTILCLNREAGAQVHSLVRDMVGDRTRIKIVCEYRLEIKSPIGNAGASIVQCAKQLKEFARNFVPETSAGIFPGRMKRTVPYD